MGVRLTTHSTSNIHADRRLGRTQSAALLMHGSAVPRLHCASQPATEPLVRNRFG